MAHSLEVDVDTVAVAADVVCDFAGCSSREARMSVFGTGRPWDCIHPEKLSSFGMFLDRRSHVQLMQELGIPDKSRKGIL